MKFLIVGVCLLTFISCTPKETEVRTEPTNQTKTRAKALNHNYEEEFLIKRVVAVEKKEAAKTQKPIAKKVKPKAKKVKPKAKVVKKETTKPAPQKRTKPKISITAKAPTPPKTKTKPKISITAKTSTPPKTKSSPKKTKEISFKLSFYTTLPEHNGGYTKTASGESIVGLKNVVANNYYPLGTKIYLEGFGTMRVADRGGSDFNSSTRLDVLIQRKGGESNVEYAARVWDMGRQTISGYIVK